MTTAMDSYTTSERETDVVEVSECLSRKVRRINGDGDDGEVWLGIHACLIDRTEKCEVPVFLWLRGGWLSAEKMWNVLIATYLMTFNFLLRYQR